MYLPTNTFLFQTLKFPWLWITTPPLKSTTLLILPLTLSVPPHVLVSHVSFSVLTINGIAPVHQLLRTNEVRPTPNCEVIITEVCLRSPRHFSVQHSQLSQQVKSSTPNSASCTCISLTFNFPCCVSSVRIVSGICRYQLWKPGIHSGSFA